MYVCACVCECAQNGRNWFDCFQLELTEFLSQELCICSPFIHLKISNNQQWFLRCSRNMSICDCLYVYLCVCVLCWCSHYACIRILVHFAVYICLHSNSCVFPTFVGGTSFLVELPIPLAAFFGLNLHFHPTIHMSAHKPFCSHSLQHSRCHIAIIFRRCNRM